MLHEIKVKRLTREQILALQKQRLDKLIAYARGNSPLFRELYQDLDPRPDLASLPVTNKRELMSAFDEWITDPSINLEVVDAFLKNEGNIGKVLGNKCRVSLTSGSTGTPCKVLSDKEMMGLSMSQYFVRTMSFWETIKIGLRWGKIFIISNPAFSMIYNSTMAQVHFSRLNRFRCAFVSMDSPPEDIIKAINHIKPAIIYTYPSMMEILLPYIKSGRLERAPNLIILGGERCPSNLVKQLNKHLKTHVLNTYGCSECGLIAYECKEGHLHIFSDWTIIEAVDKENNRVPPGVQSDKILVTNLGNYIQPFIRYEIDDRVTYQDEYCPCGNVLPFMAVEGRINDTLELKSRSGRVSVSPMSLESPSEIDGILRYQLVQTHLDRIEVRIMVDNGFSMPDIFQKVKEDLLKTLRNMEIDGVEIVLADKLPQKDPASGKFKMIERQIEAPENMESSS
jgi:phenylacetate-CoA ligase